MKKNDQAHSARPHVVCAIIAIPLIICSLALIAVKWRSKPTEPVPTRISAQQTASIPVRRVEISHVAIQPADDVAPETEAALEAVGLSAKNGIKLAVVAKSLPPVILPQTR